MTERKTKTFIFEGLGFPVILENAPWKKVFGEWALDINLKKLQEVVLQNLINKSSSITGDELRFIRKYLEKTTAEFGKMFAVSHVAVVKWENNRSQINPATELCIRLYVMDQLISKDNEFRQLYHDMCIKTLVKHKKSIRKRPIRTNTKIELCA